ncbi:hypothetical protein BGW42_004766 [Actinomortierella wolfii]|nr:hypothetical protein BGW42_004766 [Actinomortierella wolfii]
MASVLARRMPRMHSAVRNLGFTSSSSSSASFYRRSSAIHLHPTQKLLLCPTSVLFTRHPFSSFSNASYSHGHHESKPRSSTGAAASAASLSDDSDRRLLSADDDLMVGHEGVEALDPKDFPELYPEQEGIDSVQSADDIENPSVLLSDKERSDEEMSWFVDASYPEKSQAQQQEGEQDGAREAFVPLWQRNAEQSRAAAATETPATASSSSDSMAASGPMTVTGLVQLLESERAKNVHVIDMRDKCDWTNWMIICEGMSERHLGNLADHVYSTIKKHAPKSHPPVMEGRDTTDWIVIDADTVVLHFMTHEARKERDLEGLWASVTNPLKLKDAADLTWDDVKGKMTKSWKEDHGRSKGEDGKRGRRGDRDIPLSEVVRW